MAEGCGGAMGVDWFQRFGDIPGVSYTPLIAVNRGRLPHVKDRPEVHTNGYSGRPTLWWPGAGGGTSASPTQRRGTARPYDEMTTDQIVRHVAETLELPGEPVDYHFAIQNPATALWQRRKIEPTVLTMVERLSRLDVELVVARPDLAATEHAGDRSYFQILTFGYLLTLYEREGALRDALDVAEIAVRFQQQQSRRDDLAARLNGIDEERSA